MDATYKTNRAGFELYGIVSNVLGAGFSIAYLLLDTSKAAMIGETHARTNAITVVPLKSDTQKPSYI